MSASEPRTRIVGDGSVHEVTPAPLGRPVWLWEGSTSGESLEERQHAFAGAFDLLENEFKAAGNGPLGVCRLVGDELELAERPEAIWPEEGLIFAGYEADGTQVRVRWF